MKNWLRRPISNHIMGISATYGGASMVSYTLANRVIDAYELSGSVAFGILGCLAIVLLSLSVLETMWLLALQDEETG